MLRSMLRLSKEALSFFHHSRAQALGSVFGIILIVLFLGFLIISGLVSQRKENSDRLLWEAVAEFRVQLATYQRAHSAYPSGQLRITFDTIFCDDPHRGFATVETCPSSRHLIDFANLLSRHQSFTYEGLPTGCADQCSDYQIDFSLATGTGFYSPGAYRADARQLTRFDD